ncbi:hypothetical protein [Occultella gossypii]|uniref:Uncharacterized protein n=1 Tax=Occultella gossypii TaxID=2800820 RepID=A0ABS7S7N5_9MICO|nr:hypothetical protein [Occultella gossypii]MBZ2196367.1 hypothetical protein [Occultella gossypii]
MTMHYQRGHEMSGYLTLTVEEDGSAQASSSGRGDLNRRTGSGMLTDAQRERLHDVAEAAGLRDLTGSSRTIGDDEVPIVVTVDSREVRVWSQDAASIPGFEEFERTVRDLADHLIGGPDGTEDGGASTQ